MKIASPIPLGSGAIVVHRALERCISNYSVIPYHRMLELMPLKLIRLAPADTQIVHTSPDYAIFVSRPNIPLVTTFHGYVLDPFIRHYSTFLQKVHYLTDLRLFTRLALARSNCVTAVSYFIADLIKSDLGYTGDIRIIFNGVDTKQFFPAKRRRQRLTRVLYIGNRTPKKGSHLLSKIAQRTKKHVIHFCIAPRTNARRKSIQNATILPVIAHEEMPGLYHDVDILLLPTVREGFSLSILEAMACGLPVVASDCSSLPEQIDHGKGGFLCPIGNVDAFAEKLNILADSPKLRQEMGDYNRAKVEKMFTLERMVNEYKDLFEEVLG